MSDLAARLRRRASAICWTAIVCEAPVAARPDDVEVEFVIHGEPRRLGFDTAAVRGCDVERANKSEMHRIGRARDRILRRLNRKEHSAAKPQPKRQEQPRNTRNTRKQRPGEFHRRLRTISTIAVQRTQRKKPISALSAFFAFFAV
jgi:hypothetical protein